MTDDELLDRTYPVHVYPDVCTDGSTCWVATHPDLPGCSAHGTDLSEAKERLKQARTAYLKFLRDSGKEIPIPDPTSPVEWQTAPRTDRPPSSDSKELVAA